MESKSQKKKPLKRSSTDSILSMLEGRPQTKRDMLRVTVAFESTGKSRTVLTTFPGDISRSDSTLVTLVRAAVDAIDLWEETSRPIRLRLRKLMDLAYYKSLKGKNTKSQNTSLTKRSSKSTK